MGQVTTLRVRHKVLQRAIDIVAKRGSFDQLSSKKRRPNRRLRRCLKTTCGFFYIIKDIRLLLEYSRNCAKAFKTSHGNKKLDVDKNDKIYHYEINIIFHRVPVERQQVPGWIEEMFKGNSYVDKRTFKEKMDAHYANQAPARDNLGTQRAQGDATASLRQPLLQ